MIAMRSDKLKRFDLIVGDENHGDIHALLQRLQLAAHLFAQLRIQVAERFVEQKHFRRKNQRARQRDALLLAAAQCRRGPVFQAGETDQSQHVGDFLCRFSAPLMPRSFNGYATFSNTVICGHSA